jgi:hypothetical protein
MPGSATLAPRGFLVVSPPFGVDIGVAVGLGLILPVAAPHWITIVVAGLGGGAGAVRGAAAATRLHSLSTRNFKTCATCEEPPEYVIYVLRIYFIYYMSCTAVVSVKC